MNPAAASIATLAGAGRFPVAPGTLASAIALPFAWLLLRYGGFPTVVIATAVLFVVGTWASDRYAQDSGAADPSECVIDEVAGQWLACAFAPLSLPGFALAFVLFRLLDIAKPWPVSAAERLPGGLGIMVDDIVAGLLAGVIVAVATTVGLV